MDENFWTLKSCNYKIELEYFFDKIQTKNNIFI